MCRPLQQTQTGETGLLLEDAKTLLAQSQNARLRYQMDGVSEVIRSCTDCAKISAIHDYRSRSVDTLFGRFRVKAPRIRHCACNARSEVSPGGPLWPLAELYPRRSTQALLRLQAELGARHSFREAARNLATLLPCARQRNTAVRNRLGQIAQDICDCDRAVPLLDQDASLPPLTVFLDGARIRCRPEDQRRHFDVVVCNIESPHMCRRFGFVQQAARSPADQLRQDLHAVG